MKFFGRSRSDLASPVAHERHARKLVGACFACKVARSPFVYMENDHDYCVECARQCWELMHLRPAGRRASDVTFGQLTGLEA